MQTKACFLFLFLCMFTSLLAQSTWMPYESSDHDFTILLPEMPLEKSKTLHTELGQLVTNSYAVSLDKKSNNFFYSINTVLYPKATFSSDSLSYNNEVLASQIEALSENLKCKVVYQNKMKVSDEEGYLFRLSDDKSGEVVKGLIVMYKDKIFTVTVFTLLDRSLNGDVDKFLNSFTLIK